MGQPFPGSKYGQCFFVTTTFANWRRFGDVPGFYERLADVLRFYLVKYDARLAGYTFMPNHLHLFPIIEAGRIGDFMRDFKKYVAQKAALDLGIRDRNIWMPRYAKTVIDSPEVLRQWLRRIHRNPVTAALVEREEDWKWSSAADYLLGVAGPLPVWKDWTQTSSYNR
jgi:REP element-mobilizing transposase RayT